MKNVFITGGSRGIGEACVRLFSSKGYNVFFTYLNNEEKAFKLCSQTGAKCYKCDVSSFKEMNAVAEKIKKECKIDIIVNNAGISQIKMFQDITEQDWDNMFDINIKGMFITVKAFVEDMINNKKGRIINISSMWGEEGASCEVHYSSSKAAVIGFTKALAKELGPSNITVNCISPGVIDTDMNNHLTIEDIECLKEETPLCSIGKSEDIAKAVMYIASEDASFITGNVLSINGGIIM